MNSLVVLFSAMVLAGAKPSYPTIITYAAPTVAFAPAAVSHQSRLDIKSTPAVVKTDIADRPAITPIAYSAPVAIAPAAVSSQSRIDIKSSPAVINTIATAPLAYSAPLAYGVPLAYGAPLAYKAPIAFGAPIAAVYNPALYAPIAPALKTIGITPETESAPASTGSLDAALPVAPMETPEVAAARAAHLEAKALEESHQIQKRSVGIVAASPVVSPYTAPIVTSYASSPIIYSPPLTRIAPIGVHTPILTSAYGIHPY